MLRWTPHKGLQRKVRPEGCALIVILFAAKRYSKSLILWEAIFLCYFFS
jgi:hypothetical protein